MRDSFRLGLVIITQDKQIFFPFKQNFHLDKTKGGRTLISATKKKQNLQRKFGKNLNL